MCRLYSPHVSLQLEQTLLSKKIIYINSCFDTRPPVYTLTLTMTASLHLDRHVLFLRSTSSLHVLRAAVYLDRRALNRHRVCRASVSAAAGRSTDCRDS
jgi:hydrogenase maturation factor